MTTGWIHHRSLRRVGTAGPPRAPPSTTGVTVVGVASSNVVTPSPSSFSRRWVWPPASFVVTNDVLARRTRPLYPHRVASLPAEVEDIFRLVVIGSNYAPGRSPAPVLPGRGRGRPVHQGRRAPAGGPALGERPDPPARKAARHAALPPRPRPGHADRRRRDLAADRPPGGCRPRVDRGRDLRARETAQRARGGGRHPEPERHAAPERARSLPPAASGRGHQGVRAGVPAAGGRAAGRNARPGPGHRPGPVAGPGQRRPRRGGVGGGHHARPSAGPGTAR